jgi:hypothetical protein
MAGAFGDFGTLTEAFMAAAVDPTRWDAAMDLAAEATDSFGAVLLPLRGRTPTMPTNQSMLPTMDAYVRGDWAHKDERYRSLPVFMRRGVSCEFDFTTPEAMARSPFYQELLRPQGLEWFGVVKVGGNTDIWGLSLQRSPVQGPFSPHELGGLAALSRRLACAAELARAFGRRGQSSWMLEAVPALPATQTLRGSQCCPCVAGKRRVLIYAVEGPVLFAEVLMRPEAWVPPLAPTPL